MNHHSKITCNMNRYYAATWEDYLRSQSLHTQIIKRSLSERNTMPWFETFFELARPRPYNCQEYPFRMKTFSLKLKDSKNLDMSTIKLIVPLTYFFTHGSLLISATKHYQPNRSISSSRNVFFCFKGQVYHRNSWEDCVLDNLKGLYSSAVLQ